MTPHMTVKDLIQELKKYPEGYDVNFFIEETNQGYGSGFEVEHECTRLGQDVVVITVLEML